MTQIWNERTTHPAELEGEEFDEYDEELDEDEEDDDDEPMTDGPDLVEPVWLKSPNYKSAVEKSAKVDAWGLCRVWYIWRDSKDLKLMLHGFKMITGLRTYDAAWREIEFLLDVLEAEADK